MEQWYIAREQESSLNRAVLYVRCHNLFVVENSTYQAFTVNRERLNRLEFCGFQEYRESCSVNIYLRYIQTSYDGVVLVF